MLCARIVAAENSCAAIVDELFFNSITGTYRNDELVRLVEGHGGCKMAGLVDFAVSLLPGMDGFPVAGCLHHEVRDQTYAAGTSQKHGLLQLEATQHLQRYTQRL